MTQYELNKKDRFLYVWKIVWIILYIVFTGFQIYAILDGYYDNLSNVQSTESNSININSMGLVLAIIVIIFGVIGYGILLIMSIAGFIVAFTNKSSPLRKKNLIIFLIGSILPVFTELILIGITMLLSNNITNTML